MKKEVVPKILYIIAMIMYGTTGCFYRFMNIPAALLMLVRAIISVLCLVLFKFIIKEKPNYDKIKSNLLWLILGGLSIGFNWVCLFEAYNNTTVANASLINYLAPALFILIAPIIFKDKFNKYKLIFVLLALVGVIMVSGVFEGEKLGGNLKGIILAILASLGYLGILIFNKKLHDVPSLDKVIVELTSASVLITPYVIVSTDFSSFVVDYKLILLVLFFSIVLTALAYIMYLGSMEKLSSIHIAVCSYIEPVTSVLLSVLLLHEDFSILGIIGGVLILGSTLLCELLKDKKEIKEEVGVINE